MTSCTTMPGTPGVIPPANLRETTALKRLLVRLRDDVVRLRERLTQLEGECQNLEAMEEAHTLTPADSVRLRDIRRTHGWMLMELAVVRAEFVALQQLGQVARARATHAASSSTRR